MLDVETLHLAQYKGDNVFVAIHIRMFNLLDEHDVYMRTKINLFSFETENEDLFAHVYILLVKKVQHADEEGHESFIAVVLC